MPASQTPIIGPNLAYIDKAADIAARKPPVPVTKLLTSVVGDDGKRYIFGKAAATITTATAVCAINYADGTVAATGGSLVSPTGVTLSTGDCAWFAQTPVA